MPIVAPAPPASVAVHSTYLNQKHFALLDGLRCIAIVTVVWFHAVGKTYTGILSYGYHGVSLFFVISGFLITTLLLRERAVAGDISLTHFYIRRTLRIFPLYYATLSLYVILVFTIERQSAPGQEFWRNLPYFLTYTSNWFVRLDPGRVIFYFAWSLATEEQFYLFWPWVIKVRHGPTALISIMVAVVIIYYGAVFAASHGAISQSILFSRVLLNLSPPICFGAILAILLHNRSSFGFMNSLFGARLSGIFALAVILVMLSVEAVDWLIYSGMTWLVAACVLRPDQPLGAVLTNSIVSRVGVVSYGIYLLHVVCINIARRLLHMQEGWPVFIIALVFAVGAAAFSFRFFETPFLRLKDRLKTRPS
jgi:peptidoglycan/LPS O-acetylase OafA/YrhL